MFVNFRSSSTSASALYIINSALRVPPGAFLDSSSLADAHYYVFSDMTTYHSKA